MISCMQAVIVIGRSPERVVVPSCPQLVRTKQTAREHDRTTSSVRPRRAHRRPPSSPARGRIGWSHAHRVTRAGGQHDNDKTDTT